MLRITKEAKRRGLHVVIASMRPQRNAADNPDPGDISRRQFDRASMRPQRNAADN